MNTKLSSFSISGVPIRKYSFQIFHLPFELVVFAVAVFAVENLVVAFELVSVELVVIVFVVNAEAVIGYADCLNYCEQRVPTIC